MYMPSRNCTYIYILLINKCREREINSICQIILFTVIRNYPEMWSYKYVDGIDFIGLGTHFFPVALPKLPKCFYTF